MELHAKSGLRFWIIMLFIISSDCNDFFAVLFDWLESWKKGGLCDWIVVDLRCGVLGLVSLDGFRYGLLKSWLAKVKAQLDWRGRPNSVVLYSPFEPKNKRYYNFSVKSSKLRGAVVN